MWTVDAQGLHSGRGWGRLETVEVRQPPTTSRNVIEKEFDLASRCSHATNHPTVKTIKKTSETLGDFQIIIKKKT